MAQGDTRLRRTDDAGVTVLTLEDPASRNSLSEAMLAALSSALAQIEGDRGIRCVVMAAEGPVFSSGHHLKEMQAHRNDADGGRGYVADLLARCAAVMTAIPRLRVPVIAAVEGLATAAGCQLVASCDLVIAGDAARFCTPGVNLGLFCSTPAVALSRNVGRKRAAEMLFTGGFIDAQKALEWGLVNRLAPPEGVMDAALEIATSLKSKPRAALALGKALFYRQLETGLAGAYDDATRTISCNMDTDYAREGVDAFLQKRPPSWKG